MIFLYLLGRVVVYYLVHWVEEEKVSVHEASQVTVNSKEDGSCTVKVGSKCYSGKIAGSGMYVNE